MNVPLYSDTDLGHESNNDKPLDDWRKPFSRDYARVVHSASFRRLQGKTQVFPGHESDFFRNRLTHSLEVAQIAEGIAERVNHTHEYFKRHPIDTRLCATAALIHDLGHPPFGHNGERALDDAMRKHGGFEGNAQTLRIVARLEKKILNADETPAGLNLTFRTLAAALKYDNAIPRSRRSNSKLVKGYYTTEAQLVRNIKEAVVGSGIKITDGFKTIECCIMDIADDIAYSTFDLEDSLKAGFLTPADILSSSGAMLEQVANKVSTALNYEFTPVKVLEVFADLFSAIVAIENNQQEFPTGMMMLVDGYRASKNLAASSHLRTKLSSQLVSEAINAVDVTLNSDYPMLSIAKLSKEASERVEVLKQYTFIATIYSSRVKLPEFRGYEVVTGIFQALSGPRGHLLMPEDVRTQFENQAIDLDAQMRIICDFVAGMTDRYAMEFHGRLHSDSAQSMFKPI